MGVLQDGHGRVGADVDRLRQIGDDRANIPQGGLIRILDEDASARGICNVVLKLAIVIYLI
jgi:hypothetical protein